MHLGTSKGTIKNSWCFSKHSWKDAWHRTARNYKRLSGQMKAAVVQRTEQRHLRSVSTVLAAVPGNSGKQRGSDFVAHERYSYLLEAKRIFSAGHSMSLTIDGVQLGDPILNVIAWDSRSKVGCICPPQARPVLGNNRQAKRW